MSLFGNNVKSGYGRTGVLTVDPETSMSGNTIIRAGTANDDGSWTKSLHIVLTPNEREGLIRELKDIIPCAPSLTDPQFRFLLDLFMCSDPRPVHDNHLPEDCPFCERLYGHKPLKRTTTHHPECKMLRHEESAYNTHDILQSLLDTEAKSRGYLDWAGAYHEFKPEGGTP